MGGSTGHIKLLQNSVQMYTITYPEEAVRVYVENKHRNNIATSTTPDYYYTS